MILIHVSVIVTLVLIITYTFVTAYIAKQYTHTVLKEN